MDTNAKNILKWNKSTLDFTSLPVVMGILNVTPDSFSDGGRFYDVDSAVQHGLEMVEAGAGIIDIGPESTRPGSGRISTDKQIARAVPVIQKLAPKIKVPISIDTCDPDVVAAAMDAGASIINDITALSDERMLHLALDKQIPVVLMHMQGEPSTMQKQPHYDNVVKEVLDYLLTRAKHAEQAGIAKELIFIDPGIGFGKTTEHNIQLLKNIDSFINSGYRVLIGASRKRFIGQLTGRDIPADRIFGTAATVSLCAVKKVSIVRVHDVGPMIDVIKVTKAIF